MAGQGGSKRRGPWGRLGRNPLDYFQKPRKEKPIFQVSYPSTGVGYICPKPFFGKNRKGGGGGVDDRSAMEQRTRKRKRSGRARKKL